MIADLTSYAKSVINFIMAYVEIFTKNGCCLCEEAKKILYNIQNLIPFELQEIDIEKNETLLKKYGNEIPVIFINNKKAFKYRVNEKDFINKLRKEAV